MSVNLSLRVYCLTLNIDYIKKRKIFFALFIELILTKCHITNAHNVMSLLSEVQFFVTALRIYVHSYANIYFIVVLYT